MNRPYNMMRFHAIRKDGKFYMGDGKEIQCDIYERHIDSPKDLLPNELEEIFNDYFVMKSQIQTTRKQLHQLFPILSNGQV